MNEISIEDLILKGLKHKKSFVVISILSLLSVFLYSFVFLKPTYVSDLVFIKSDFTDSMEEFSLILEKKPINFLDKIEEKILKIEKKGKFESEKKLKNLYFENLYTLLSNKNYIFENYFKDLIKDEPYEEKITFLNFKKNYLVEYDKSNINFPLISLQFTSSEKIELKLFQIINKINEHFFFNAEQNILVFEKQAYTHLKNKFEINSQLLKDKISLMDSQYKSITDMNAIDQNVFILTSILRDKIKLMDIQRKLIADDSSMDKKEFTSVITNLEENITSFNQLSDNKFVVYVLNFIQNRSKLENDLLTTESAYLRTLSEFKENYSIQKSELAKVEKSITNIEYSFYRIKISKIKLIGIGIIFSILFCILYILTVYLIQLEKKTKHG